MHLSMFCIPTVVQRMWWVPVVQWNKGMECVRVGIQSCGLLGRGELGNLIHFWKFSVLIHSTYSMKYYMSGSMQFIWTWTPKFKSRRNLRSNQKFSWKTFLRWAQWFNLMWSARTWSEGWQVPHGMEAGKGLACTSVKTKHLLVSHLKENEPGDLQRPFPTSTTLILWNDPLWLPVHCCTGTQQK